MKRTPGKVGTDVDTIFDDSADQRLGDAAVVLHTRFVMQRLLNGHRVLVLDGETVFSHAGYMAMSKDGPIRLVAPDDLLDRHLIPLQGQT